MNLPHIRAYLDSLSAGSPLTVSSFALSPGHATSAQDPHTIPQRAGREFPDNQVSAPTEMANAELSEVRVPFPSSSYAS